MSRRNTLLCAGLILGCVAIYGQTLAGNFVAYDDPLYVTENAEVQAGLSWSGVVWAFTTDRALYLHPLTWLSHMLDCTLYGLNPWGHHLTSVLFHCANTVLLFVVLARMTKGVWPAAVAAALWGLHPLRVESVAWIAERKDVLSMLFWVLGMWAHLRYRERPGPVRYLGVAVMFVLGFLSKPMMVTFPCVLLLLDYWPLGRVDRTEPLAAMAGRIARLAVEKAPLFLLTVAMSAVTYVMQSSSDNLRYMSKISLADRCVNAVVVYVLYVVKTLWPAGLAPYYPHPVHRPLWQLALAAPVLLALTLLCLKNMRSRPWLLVGWLWYLGTLVPVIELIQAGSFSHADRYTYIPAVGICIMAAFTLNELRERGRVARTVIDTAVVLAVLAYTGAAARQTAYWKDTETLFRHALEVTPDNSISQNNLACGLYEKKRYDEALEHCERALKLAPGNNVAMEGMGMILHDQGRYEEALVKHREALALMPDDPKAQRNLRKTLKALGRLDATEEEYGRLHETPFKSVDDLCRLGTLAMKLGKPDDAFKAFEAALKMEPDSKRVYNAVGDVLAGDGKFADALQYYEKALRADPADAQTLYNMGFVLSKLDRPEEAAAKYREAVRVKPDFAQALNNLGGILANAQQLDGAAECFRKAAALDPKYVEPRLNLANLLAVQGRSEDALRLLEESVAANSASVPARLSLAGMLVALKRYDEAEAQAKKALELEPGNRDGVAMTNQIAAGRAAEPTAGAGQ